MGRSDFTTATSAVASADLSTLLQSFRACILAEFTSPLFKIQTRLYLDPLTSLHGPDAARRPLNLNTVFSISNLDQHLNLDFDATFDVQQEDLGAELGLQLG